VQYRGVTAHITARDRSLGGKKWWNVFQNRELQDLIHIAVQQNHEVPAELPSDLLEQRSDIREAEAQLIVANGQISVPKAAYFLQISLMATSGFRDRLP
jgi:outer membrane protein TolC